MISFKMIAQDLVKQTLKDGFMKTLIASALVLALVLAYSFSSGYKALVHVADYQEQNKIWKTCHFVKKTALVIFKMGIMDNSFKSSSKIQNEIDLNQQKELTQAHADTFMVAEYTDSPAAYTIQGQLYNCNK